MLQEKPLEKKKKNRLPAILAILAVVVLIAEGIAGYWLSTRWAQMSRADAQLHDRQSELEAQLAQAQQQSAELTEAQGELEQQLAVNRELQAELESEQQELDQAQQLAEENRKQVEQWTKDIVESRRSVPSNYSHLYPKLYAAPAALETRAPANTVYLTFDDGPSARTAEILDILKANDIKATFFVQGRGDEAAQALMRRVVEEGHTIAVHTYTHQYEKIYASVESYLYDFNRIYNWIYEVTGVYPQIFRFPGGSINSYNRPIYKDIVKEMDRRGFVHYDWNALNGDSEGIDYTVEEMTQKSLKMLGTSHVIILMHDAETKYKTVECLQGVIDGYRNAGYRFAELTPEIKAITYDK